MSPAKFLLFCATLSTVSVVRSKKTAKSCKKLSVREGLMSSVFENLDANLALDSNQETFSHSDLESDPFILVMFDEDRVGDVKIYNVQQDCCYDQLNGANVILLNDDMDETLCGTIKVTKTDEYVKVNCNGAVGTSVKVEIPGEKYLHIREIEVFQKCPADERKEKKEKKKKKKGGDSRCGGGLTWCDGACKHIHMCGKNFG